MTGRRCDSRPWRRRRAAAVQVSWLHRYAPAPTREPDWNRLANCRGVAYEDVTPSTCDGCPCRLACLQDAFRVESELALVQVAGVRGGIPAAARRRWLAERSDPTRR